VPNRPPLNIDHGRYLYCLLRLKNDEMATKTNL
jgi:hypothetical protein